MTSHSSSSSGKQPGGTGPLNPALPGPDPRRSNLTSSSPGVDPLRGNITPTSPGVDPLRGNMTEQVGTGKLSGTGLLSGWEERPAAYDLANGVRFCPYDLLNRAELAIAGCTGLLDMGHGGLPYSYAELHCDPPIAIHAAWDYADTAGRLLEAVTLARVMTGMPPDAIDDALAQVLRDYQRPSGLMEVPVAPWIHSQTPTVELEWSQSGALLAWTSRYCVVDDQDARTRGLRLVSALSKVAVWEGNTCWYPGPVLPQNGWTDRFPPVGKLTHGLIGGQLVFALTRFADMVDCDEALALAKGLIRWLRERSGAFGSDGSLTPQAAHYLHSNTGFLLGALKHGIMTNDRGEIDWARQAYHHIRDMGTDFGFFPHSSSGHGIEQGDVATTGDMIAMAILLGLHVDHAYYADADRWGRNHLLESQHLDFDWITNGVDADFPPELWCAKIGKDGLSGDEVATRSIGTFAGWSKPNDGVDPRHPRLVQRNTARGTRSLYSLWRYAITRPEEAVMVNLHFSRDSRWASVTSHLPQEGGVDVLMKTNGVLAVRVPEGVTNDQVEVTVNKQPRNETIRNGYAWLEALRRGDAVAVRWPLAERTETYDIGGVTYTGKWRGDTLMRMNPPGLLSPLYKRSERVAVAKPRHAHAHGHHEEISSL